MGQGSNKSGWSRTCAAKTAMSMLVHHDIWQISLSNSGNCMQVYWGNLQRAGAHGDSSKHVQ